VRVIDPVGVDTLSNGGFSVSADGRLAYRGNEGGGLRQLKWYDRTGKAMGVAGGPDSATPLYPELSPDGRHVAFQRRLQGNLDVWLLDLVRGDMNRFTLDPSIESSPVWSPDGMWVAFESTRNGIGNLYLKPSSGAGTEQLLLENPDNKWPLDWSKDGRFLLYSEADQKAGRDIWALPVREARGREAGAVNNTNDRKPISVVKTPFDELNGQFSPDGRWVAYETNESGRFEIIVQPFPVATAKWQVSTGGGIQPRWRADGKELYFIAPDGKLMAASITTGETFAAGRPVALFTVALAPGAGNNKQEYVVSRDDRFLVNQPLEAPIPKPITLILNWHPPIP
jgi:dipeptidyl aminopeptidase/acylaminoacyl peptidase